MGTVVFEDTLLDATGSGVTGSTGLGVIVTRLADGFIYDFNDSSFKAAGWITKRQAMAEVDAVELPGSYRLSVTVTAWDDGGYIGYFDYDGSDVGLTPYRCPLSFWVFAGEEAEAVAMRGTDNAALAATALALTSNIDGALDLQKTLKVLLALSVAKEVDVAGAVFTFLNQSGLPEATATYGPASTTVVIAP